MFAFLDLLSEKNIVNIDENGRVSFNIEEFANIENKEEIIKDALRKVNKYTEEALKAEYENSEQVPVHEEFNI